MLTKVINKKAAVRQNLFVYRKKAQRNENYKLPKQQKKQQMETPAQYKSLVIFRYNLQHVLFQMAPMHIGESFIVVLLSKLLKFVIR